MACLIESTNTCKNAVNIFRSSLPANRLLYPQGMWSSNMLVLNISSLAYRSDPLYLVNVNGWLEVISLLLCVYQLTRI